MDGYVSFNRYYFSQVDKQAAIIDERYNHGGFLADYIVDYLNRPVLNRVMTRFSNEDVSVPTEAIYGPKVMIINRICGFRRRCDAVVFPASEYRAAGGKAHVGRIGGIMAAIRC